eukprot:364173-Chlamydomonas_euryale.AAC.1
MHPPPLRDPGVNKVRPFTGRPALRPGGFRAAPPCVACRVFFHRHRAALLLCPLVDVLAVSVAGVPAELPCIRPAAAPVGATMRVAIAAAAASYFTRASKAPHEIDFRSVLTFQT